MTRCAREQRVLFVEEPEFIPIASPQLRLDDSGPVTVVVPQLPEQAMPDECCQILRQMMSSLIRLHHVSDYVLWYYTPMALAFTDHLSPVATVYDCMDELSAFKGAPTILKERETDLLRRADLVLTGGHSLYEAKRHLHANIHAVPSSVDVMHFARARGTSADPLDQRAIPHPRLGFFGVIDERMDTALIDGLAAARPDWHIVLLGPVVKIDPASLPRRANIHYLGSKAYDDLPSYIAGWDVALLPFARNASTRFISPTKTPEYLAAGRPVVSTSIEDVVRPYGERGLVRIADTVPAFVRACAAAMAEDASHRIGKVDAFLRHTSWDATWTHIRLLMDGVIGAAAVKSRDGDMALAASSVRGARKDQGNACSTI